MAFTFQINNNIKFKHDQRLIDKSRSFRPSLVHQSYDAVAIVKLVKNSKLLNGYGLKKTADVSELSKKSFKRNQRIILDFGDHRVGKFSINIKSVGSPMDAPLFIKFKFAEMPPELAQNSVDYEGWLSKSWIQEEYIHLDTLPTKLELPRRYSFRYVEITVLDTSAKWQVVFEHPNVITESSANLSSLKARTLSDPELNEIYKVGLKTLEDSMQDVFEDGPKRDRRLWLGDLRLQALANYATFKNSDLVKRCLYLFGAMPSEDGRIAANVFAKPKELPDDTFLFDYSLFFISVLADYENFNHDATVLYDLYAVAKKQMNVALKQVTKNGELILNDDYPVFIDWSNNFDKSTAGQAILIYTLKQFITLARQVKDSEIDFYLQKLMDLEKFTKKYLFDKETNLFISGPQKEINVASQVWMVLANVFNNKSNHKIMKETINQLFPVKGVVTPYMYHHITQALFEADLKSEAVDLMKSYWGKMVRLGADTYWETFDPDQPNYSPYGNSILNSYCHAWGCTPIYLIEKYLL